MTGSAIIAAALQETVTGCRPDDPGTGPSGAVPTPAGDRPGGRGQVDDATPADALAVSAPALTVGRGRTAEVSVTASGSVGGPPLAVTVGGVPPGVLVAVAPAAVTPGSPARVVVTALPSAAPGRYPITVTGTGSSAGAGPRTATFTVTVS